MTRTEIKIIIEYLKSIQEKYIEGEGYARHPLPEWYALDNAIKALEQEPKAGHWIKISPAGIYECSECHQNVMTNDIDAYGYCHGCGCRMECEGMKNDR